MLGELDKRIILELQKDGRTSFKTIARRLEVSDGTVRSRVGRMIRHKVLRIAASINPFVFENGIAALVGMQLEKRTHKETMARISRLHGVTSVCNVTGRYDLLVRVFFESRQELRRFLVDELSRIGGINTTETFVYLDAINEWTRLADGE
ncbi:MAG: Lrp/AsnC family transcriptional regulator [Deltaproteobacteria bacterium]|nr:Lrp/AsnC family transcriptional regulator [Deltaproteobacteria bacterium]MBW2122001.1 Lrp/AsnC family transcriptional regulator [Deltaproteobacteria bacterium]